MIFARIIGHQENERIGAILDMQKFTQRRARSPNFRCVGAIFLRFMDLAD
jgi:hypothetical protein